MRIFSILILLFTCLNSVLPAPKKIYLMELRSNDASKSQEFRKVFKQAFTREKNYELIDEDTIKDLNEKLKKLQMYGCDETRCLQEISNSFGADEIISGDLKVLANQYFLNLKVTKRDPESFEVGIKTSIQKSFYEEQQSYYIKEFIKIIENPTYSINDSNAPPIGENKGYRKTLPILIPKAPPTFTPLNFTKEVETQEDALNLYIATGDKFFVKKEYTIALEKYKMALDYSLGRKITPKLNLYERMDACLVYPLFESYPSVSISGDRLWLTNEMESSILPAYLEIRQKYTRYPSSDAFKAYYMELKEIADTNLGLLLAESLNLLYSSNRLDEYITRYKNLETFLTEVKITGEKQLSFINERKSIEQNRKNSIERDYLPVWNEELRRNCTTIFISAKVFPYLQMETGEAYSNTLGSLKQLSIKIKEKMNSSKGAITEETRSICQGVR